MKTMISFAGSLLFLTSFLFLTTCKEEENNNPFDDEARQQYEAIIALQDECENILLNFQSTMDSAAAVAATADWFRSNAMVESATVSSQGISVVYANGVWGGLFIDGERYDMDPENSVPGDYYLSEFKGDKLKNIPTGKKVHFIALFNSEFEDANRYQSYYWNAAFESLDYEFYMHKALDLNSFNYLMNSHAGIVCFDSHGYAWPEKNDIKEVYFIIPTAVTRELTQQYYQDLLNKDIILMRRLNPPETVYAIGPGFVKKYGDFSQDTVLFYGGFCYSFLGTWPSITENCASGTYFGFDWIVQSSNCALWAVDLIQKMADKSAPEPWTVEDWMTKSTIEKQYFAAHHNRTIHILYEGNGALTLWEKEESGEGVIEAVAADGAPVAQPGLTCQEYTLRCKMEGQLPAQVSYTWDISEGNGKNLGQSGNELTCLYIFPGNHPVKVEVKNSATGEIIKEITGQVQLNDPAGFLDILKDFEKLWGGFNPNAVHLTDGMTAPNSAFAFNTGDVWFTTPLTWTDSSFMVQSESTSGGASYILRRLTGEISSDGKVLKNLVWMINEKNNDVLDYEVILELANIPIFSRDEWNCFYYFLWQIHGADSQPYVVDIQYRDYNYQAQEWITIQYIDWENSYLYGYFEN